MSEDVDRIWYVTFLTSDVEDVLRQWRQKPSDNVRQIITYLTFDEEREEGWSMVTCGGRFVRSGEVPPGLTHTEALRLQEMVIASAKAQLDSLSHVAKKSFPDPVQYFFLHAIPASSCPAKDSS